jgi:hypothetical protein
MAYKDLGITNVATYDETPLMASFKDQDAYDVEVTLGHPLAYHQRGALMALKTSDSIVYDWISGGSGGIETLYGVLKNDYDSIDDDQPATLIVSGDINRAACVSVSTIPTGLQNYGKLNFVDEV